MKSILDHLVAKINEAEMDQLPSENFYVENIFSPEIYQEILARLPSDDHYDFINHPDATLPDGRVTRKLLDLTDETLNRLSADDQAFWRQLKEVLTSKELQQALFKKFAVPMQKRFGNTLPEAVSVPIFYRDFPGYRISEHTDAPYKIITMQFYFPEDHSQIHLGTTFHLREGNRFKFLKRNPFKPNTAYAFARTDNSWHSVQEMAANESKRNSLALTIYEKGSEYKSDKGYR